MEAEQRARRQRQLRKELEGDGQTVEGQPVENGEETPGFVPDSKAPAQVPPAEGSQDRGDVLDEEDNKQ
jgi:hypothetical protein